MRRFTFILLTLTLLPLVTFGQIKVNSSGRAFFGSGTNTNSYGAINLTTDGTTNGISFTGTSATRYNIFKYSDKLHIGPASSINVGMKMGPTGGIAMTNYNLWDAWTTPVLTMVSKTTTVIEAHGMYDFAGGETVKTYVYSPSTYGYSISTKFSPYQIVFYAKGDGTVYAKNGYIQSSDAANKEDIKPLENSLDKISALSAVSFYYKDFAEQAVKDLANYDPEALKNHGNVDSTGVQREIKRETIEQMKTEAYRKRLGLIAQEVEKVVPEVVRTMDDGKKGIMYSDLVSLLIEGIKELKTTVDQQEAINQAQENYIYELEDRLNKVEAILPVIDKKYIKETSDLSATQEVPPALYQNRPNPFNQETEIGYVIPENKNAYIGIYNLNGTQLKKYPLENKTQGSILISASEFAPGIYLYSLIIDNEEVDSKKMVLTD